MMKTTLSVFGQRNRYRKSPKPNQYTSCFLEAFMKGEGAIGRTVGEAATCYWLLRCRRRGRRRPICHEVGRMLSSQNRFSPTASSLAWVLGHGFSLHFTN